MTSLIKNQILKHLTKFFKDLAPEQLQLSAFKGSCELSNLQLEENVLMELLSFPAWITINKATCDQLTIRIPWTKIKSVPIQMNLNEVTVEVEICEEFRDISNGNDDTNLSNLINSQAPGKYGFVDRVIDGMTVTVNNVLISFKSRIMSATFNLSRVILESRCPNWKPGELSLTRIKEINRGQILLFKIAEWQTMRLEAKCLTDPNQAPLRLITNHAQCRLTIKKKLDDCSVIAARIFVIFEDILWVLTFAQFTSAASFVEYIFTLIKRSPMSKKNNISFDETSETSNNSSFGVPPQSAPPNSPLNSSILSNPSEKQPILTGNLSSASLLEQKFLCYDLIETSLHLFIDKVDAHLYDDIEISPSSSSRDYGGALQTTLDQIQVDCYPYSRAQSDRKHWYKWFDPSPNSRKQWFMGHFTEFDLLQVQRNFNQTRNNDDKIKSKPFDKFIDHASNKRVPIAVDEQLLSLTVLIKIKDYCMNCVATRHSSRGDGFNKFIQTDKDYQMPSDMPSLYLELNYFYYFDIINRMMVYDNVPDPLAFMHLSPTKLLFDSPTLVFLNLFQANLLKALEHLNDLFPEQTSAPKIHCRIEILMPQISLPAKANSDQPKDQQATSTLLIKSGKLILSNSLHDKELLSKMMKSIEILKENPSQPINFSGYQTNSATRENSCTGDWTKVWNASLIDEISEFSLHNQLWAIQFEPVWMDFMNYDVDTLNSSQRLEPIVEPVNAYAFIHLDLSSAHSNSKSGDSKETSATNKRDTISILISVIDGPILANMDKVQLSFLQRLGMQVEKLLQQIKAEASNIIQMDTIVENSLEINLTAYIKEIKARLILDKKIETRMTSTNELNSSVLRRTAGFKEADGSNLSDIFNYSSKAPIKIVEQLPTEETETRIVGDVATLESQIETSIQDNKSLSLIYQPAFESSDVHLGSSVSLDECIEVADDASCLLLDTRTSLPESSPHGQSNSATSMASVSSTADNDGISNLSRLKSETTTNRSTKPLEESLLINLDDIEQASNLFEKVDLRPKSPPKKQQQQQQEIETESISYLELSMSQLMVRRITETKRRQKF